MVEDEVDGGSEGGWEEMGMDKQVQRRSDEEWEEEMKVGKQETEKWEHKLEKIK